MAKKELKTNAMRILEKKKIPFTYITYECEEFVDGVQIADKLGQPHELVHKTLVTVAKSREYYVFVIPIEEELDFKKAARVVGEKSLLMLPPERSDCRDRVYQGRMHCDWDEKAVSGCRRKMCRGLGGNDCKWRQNRNADQINAAGFSKSDRSGV